MLASASILLRRQRPGHMDDERIAVSLPQLLPAVAASWQDRPICDENLACRFCLFVPKLGLRFLGEQEHDSCDAGQEQSMQREDRFARNRNTLQDARMCPPSATFPARRHVQAEAFQCVASNHVFVFFFGEVPSSVASNFKFQRVRLQVLCSPELQRLRVPMLDLLTDNEDNKTQTSMRMRRVDMS